MADNPLKRHFRQSSLSVRLPSMGLWYTDDDVELIVGADGKKELSIFPLTSVDDVLLNTPDSMLNGHSLEKVIKSCAPGVKNVKKLMLPDLETIFVGIKSATNNGKVEYARSCPKCEFENVFDMLCQKLLETSTFVNEDDLTIKFSDELLIHVKPYDFEMRQMFIKREFDEERTLRALDTPNNTLDELEKAAILGESVDRLSKITFTLVSRSIEKIVMLKDNITITNMEHINEWLVSISKQQADIIIEAVNKLNAVGIIKTIPVVCSSCGHQWEDALTFDPSSFFAKRS